MLRSTQDKRSNYFQLSKSWLSKTTHAAIAGTANVLCRLLRSLKTVQNSLRLRNEATVTGMLALGLAFSFFFPIVLGYPATAFAAADVYDSLPPILSTEVESQPALPSLQHTEISALLGYNDTYRSGAPTTVPESEWTQYTVLGPGDQCEAVKRLQDRLMELDYFDNDETDDYYGTETKYSVQLFERQCGLVVDGIAGPLTQMLLFSSNAQPYTIYPGCSGPDIEGLQRRLKELNYYPGEISGSFEASTEAAVRSFQMLNGLSINGVVDCGTRDLIFSPEAKEYASSTIEPTRQPKEDAPTSSKITQMLAFAKQQLGKRYMRGAEGAKTFDCSGFSYYVLTHMGEQTGRYNAAGFSKIKAWTKVTSFNSLKAGDLVFFRSNGSKRVSHMAIYIGDEKIIHASSSRGRVIISDMTSYYKRNFVCGRRMFS